MDKAKEKFNAAAPYVDRKPPKGMEFSEPDPLCPRCQRRMSWIETETGSLKRWCLHCYGASGESI